MSNTANINDVKIEKFVLFNYKHLEMNDEKIKSIKSDTNGDVIDLMNSNLEFDIEESLFSTNLKMSIYVKNSLALSSVMPIIGEELVHIKFKTPSVDPDNFTYEPIDLVMQVVKMTDYKMTKSREESFILHLVSRHCVKNLEKRINKAFKNMPIEQMVYICATESGINMDKFIPDSTVGNHHFVIPNWTPIDTIIWLCGETQSTISPDTSNFIFYEDHTSTHFTSLEAIISKNDYDIEYYLTEQSLNYNVAEVLSEKSDKNPEEFRYIQGISYDKKFDVENSYINGMYTNQTLYIDPLTQTFMATKVNGKEHFQYDEHFNNNKKINETNDYKLISERKKFKDSKPSHIRYLITNKNQDKSFESFPRKRQDFLPNAISSIGQLFQIQCTIVVPGDSDRKPGNIINFNVPELGATDDIIDRYNRFFRGRWLVIDVRHIVNRTGAYRTVLLISKNSFEEKIEELTTNDINTEVGDSISA